MNLDELKAEFDRMEHEAFRLQQQQSYAGVRSPEWEAWQAGKPLPVITTAAGSVNCYSGCARTPV